MPFASWIVLGLGSLAAGFSKTAVGGVSTVAVALFAAVLPVRESTGTLLLLFITGDLVAIVTYRKYVDWALLARLIVPVALGVVAGAVFLGNVDDRVMKLTIAIILLALTGFQLVRWLLQLRSGRANPPPTTSDDLAADVGARALSTGSADVGSQALSTGAADVAPASPAVGRIRRLLPSPSGGIYGALSGFTTMVANTGGPPMNLYLLSMRVDKMRFLGITAWFFFGVNVFKVPFAIALHTITPGNLPTVAIMMPIVLVGTWIGRLCIKHINQRMFEILVIVFTVVAALNLLR